MHCRLVLRAARPAVSAWFGVFAFGTLSIAFVAAAAGPARADDADGPGPQPLASTAPVTTPAARRGPPAPPPPPPPSLAPGRATVAAPRSSEWAATLAARLGLAYQDGGAFVLLSDATTRVRIYPNTHLISLDGRDMQLRGMPSREAGGVLVPGPAAGIIEAHVLGSRKPVAAPAPVGPPPAPPKPPVAPAKAAAPAAAPAAVRPVSPGRIAPDPSWVVAPTSRKWTWIVLHHSDDVSGCMSKYHQGHLDKGWEHGCGYHFVIGNGTQSGDGEVEASNRWRQQLQGAHAKTPDNEFNDHGIGICLVGNFEVGTSRPSAAQMRSLLRLSQWLMDRYDIPLANVRGHCHCKPTCCPGKNFPWTELRGGLRDSRAAAQIAAAPAVPAAMPLAQRVPAVPPAGTLPPLGPAGLAVAGGTAPLAPAHSPAGHPPAAPWPRPSAPTIAAGPADTPGTR